MAKKIRVNGIAAFILIASFFHLRLSAQIQIFEKENWSALQAAAQDGSGMIYATDAQPNRWFRWNENGQPVSFNSFWTGWSSSFGTDAVAAAFGTAADGNAYSIWHSEKDGNTVAWFAEKNLRRGNLHGPAKLTTVMTDSKTNLWLMEAALNILKSSRAKGHAYKTVHTITTDELYPGGDATNRSPVSMMEDARGRIWFWSNYLLGGDERGAIRGALIFDADEMTLHPRFEGTATNRISVLAPISKTNLWIAVRDAGIFSVDVESLHGSPVAEPQPGAFRVVQKIFSDGEDRYVIAGSASDYDENGLLNSLWRLRAGQWEKLISGLDSDGAMEQFADRRWIFAADGLWLGAFGTGGWFVPREDGEPRQINWQNNSPFDSIHRWFQVKNGQILGIQFNRGGLLADAPLLLTKPAVAPSSEVFRATRPLLQTGDGKIFAVLRQKESALSEWDGKKWQHHPLPNGLQLWGDCQLLTDSKNRVWFIDGNWNPDPRLRPCLIFDSTSGKFERYSGFPTALQAQAAKLADTRLGNGDAIFTAAFSRDGRICYEDRTTEVRYFDGHEWHHWNKNIIVAAGLMNSGSKPYFDRDNRLSIFLNNKVWQLDDLGKWRATTEEPPKTTDSAATTSPPYLPEADSIVPDRRGIFWATVRKQLFCAGYGLRVSRFAPNEPQPFIDGRKILEALMDNFGNAFLRTRVASREEYVLIPARGKLPDTKARLAEESDDAVTVEISGGATQPRFIWRVDDAAWNNATTNTHLRLDDLANGKHRVQVAAIDESLQMDPAPAEVLFEIRSNPTERIQKLISQLGDKDFSKREAAIKLLARHPETVLVELREALKKTAISDQQWWIESAIRECEENQRKSGAKND